MAAKKNFFVSLGISLWILTVIFALLPSWPHLYYRLSPQTSTVLASTIASTVTDIPNLAAFEPTPSISRPTFPTTTPIPTPMPTPEIILPEVDPALPAENGLIIEEIGVRGEIHEGDDWEEILKKGIWRVPNFGTPEDTSKPIILAAHRWGYLEWSAAFRKLNSFYSLPQVKVGDKIRLVWNQRPFEYQVTTINSGTEITDYSSDLILYTCQLWNSPLRFFAYAKRIK